MPMAAAAARNAIRLPMKNSTVTRLRQGRVREDYSLLADS